VAITCYDEVKPGQVTLTEFLNNQPAPGPLNDTESYYTGQQRAWLARWLRESADKLLLNNWTLRLWHEPPADDAHASVFATTGRVYAAFRFDNAIFEVSPEDARNHLAHELCHVLFEAPTQMIEHDLNGLLADQTLTLFKSAYRRQMEFAIDHLASLVAPLLSLPPWIGWPLEERSRKANTTAQDRYAAEQEHNNALAMPTPGTLTVASTVTTNWRTNTMTSGHAPPADAEDPPAEQ